MKILNLYGPTKYISFKTNRTKPLKTGKQAKESGLRGKKEAETWRNRGAQARERAQQEAKKVRDKEYRRDSLTTN